MWPFTIVKDRRFQSLMKTGRPDYHIPSPKTVSCNIKKVFVHCCQRISKILQVGTVLTIQSDIWLPNPPECIGALSFTTDAWTSPNNKAYITVTVHFEQEGVPVLMLLDLAEVAKLHSGLNLAVAFAMILEDFGIANKVSFPITMN